MLKNVCGLLTPSKTYKPTRYPWAYEAWKQQRKIDWDVDELIMANDLSDWKFKLTDNERSLLTNIFRFFVQADIDVRQSYQDKFVSIFGPTEIQMMLNVFMYFETIHVDAYSHLIDSLNMPESTYQEFLEYEQMKAKSDYLENFNVETPRDIAKSLAVVSGFVEGVQLYSSFAILLNFPRHNKLMNMGQIIAWSARDESLHCECMIKLFRTFISENREIWDNKLKGEIYDAAEDIIALEDKFIDLCFEQGQSEDLDPTDVKQYIRYICGRRLIELGLRNIFPVKNNPLPWLDVMLNGMEFSNFFEQRSTAYAKNSTTGTWDDVKATFK